MVSACLAGINCRYDGKNSEIKEISKIVKAGKALPLCPEVLGGLKIPRTSCEIIEVRGERRVINEDGEDYTDHFKKGAEKTLEICRITGIEKAVLKDKSPSCGSRKIYDGQFEGNIIPGRGITARLLSLEGIEIYDEFSLENITSS